MNSENDLAAVNAYIERWWDQLEAGRFRKEDYDAFESDLLKAKNLLDDILQIDPDSEDAIFALVRWHLCCSRVNSCFAGNKYRIEKSVSHMEAVVEMCPGIAEYKALLGVCYRQRGDKQLAIEQFRKALEADPNCDEARQELKGLTEGSTNTPSRKSGCFIATASFETPFAPEVIALRTFRDNVVSQTVLGRCFISLYYFASPSVARLVSSSRTLKTASRAFLTCVVMVLQRRQSKQAAQPSKMTIPTENDQRRPQWNVPRT